MVPIVPHIEMPPGTSILNFKNDYLSERYICHIHILTRYAAHITIVTLNSLNVGINKNSTMHIASNRVTYRKYCIIWL